LVETVADLDQRFLIQVLLTGRGDLNGTCGLTGFAEEPFDTSRPEE
jgi:hypothetical protein